MKALGELAGDAQGRGVAGAGGTADFNESGGRLLGNAHSEAIGAAHEDMGGLAVDEHGGRAEAEGAEMGADQLDFAVGERGGGNDEVDAGFWENFRGGLGAGAGHVLDL
jgi:hypothetical protein